MVCNVIDECRCYQYKDSYKQFCGVRRSKNVLPCHKSCCAGGCPTDGSRQPFRIINRVKSNRQIMSTTNTKLIMVILICLLLLLFYMDLKIKHVR